ncbi:MAG: glucuronate isomerase [Phycisphaerae bacterium]
MTSNATDSIVEMDKIETTVRDIVGREPICDMHTHLYPPTFGTPVPNRTGRVDAAGLMLWGIDELVTYHYLIAEVFRVVPSSRLPCETFWSWPKQRQADHIWQYLFVENTPISEACRGILTTLTRLGLDPNEKSLSAYRSFFNQQDPDEYIDRVMELSHVQSITMTNAVFDDNERNRWLAEPSIAKDSRFRAVLRIDPLVQNFPFAADKLRQWGYQTDSRPTSPTMAEFRRFLSDWLGRQDAIYMAISLPPEFMYPAPTADPVAAAGQCVLEEAILPLCAQRKIPLALMIGSRRQINPALRDAGDTVSKGDVPSVGRLCRNFPDNKFLVTMLSRENQHELCVTARKFSNLMPFGCWWFLNNPSLITEITEMRFELLGRTFVPQHSDARVLDQLIYKWDHSREIIAGVLTDMYRRTARTGRKIRLQDIQRDTTALFSGNFEAFLTDR